jgi:hypothetical protein
MSKEAAQFMSPAAGRTRKSLDASCGTAPLSGRHRMEQSEMRFESSPRRC